jgi:hypothetical protein
MEIIFKRQLTFLVLVRREKLNPERRHRHYPREYTPILLKQQNTPEKAGGRRRLDRQMTGGGLRECAQNVPLSHLKLGSHLSRLHLKQDIWHHPIHFRIAVLPTGDRRTRPSAIGDDPATL